MNEIELFLKNSIQKNTGFLIEKSDDNILEKDISPLDLLYVIMDIEQEYSVSSKNLISNVSPDLFTIRQIAKIISEKYGN